MLLDNFQVLYDNVRLGLFKHDKIVEHNFAMPKSLQMGLNKLEV
jgi:hypothetical protein